MKRRAFLRRMAFAALACPMIYDLVGRTPEVAPFGTSVMEEMTPFQRQLSYERSKRLNEFARQYGDRLLGLVP